MVDIICFRFHPSTTNYKIGNFKEVNWNSNNSITLSHALMNQINNNYINLHLLKDSCEKNIQENFTIQNDNNITYLQKYNSNRSLCDKFLHLYKPYKYIFGIDVEAIYQNNFNVDLYCVVIFHDGEYYGHVFTWISPIEPLYCLSIGIRNRVDSVFLKNTDKELPNVTTYLMEGVRRFAEMNGCMYSTTLYPEPILRDKLLPEIGFFYDKIPLYYFGISIHSSFVPDESLTCDVCLSLSNISYPITNNINSFSFYD